MTFWDHPDRPWPEAAEALRRRPEDLPPPFEWLMADLRRQGFVIGVDHYLRLAAVLRRFGPESRLKSGLKSDPARLRTLLCPIFATNADQQAKFYRSFDRFVPPAPAPPEEAPDRTAAGKGETPESDAAGAVVVPRWQYALAAVLWIILIGLGIWQFMGEPQPGSVTVQPIERPDPPPPDETPRLPDIRVTIRMAEAVPAETGWFQRYGRPLRWAAGLTPLVIWLFWLLYRDRRLRMVLERARFRKPPYIWPIRIDPEPPRFLNTRRFHRAAALLRQRLAGDARVLDVHATLSATVESGGFPSPRYAPVTRPPEYLVLVQRFERGDHRGGFLETLADTLETEGVFMDRFYYAGDPRICFKRPTDPRQSLKTIRDRHPDRRLIVLGTGEGLLDPMTGDLEPWTELFEAWPDRALLTPEPPPCWGMREVNLARRFAVLPAGVEGLNAITDAFEADRPPDLKTWVRNDAGHPPVQPGDLSADAFRRRMDGDTFQWLCACAVYPELNWRLTLHLGMMGGRRVTEQGLLDLVRLPWFRQGALPDALRLELIAELDEDRLREVREAVYRLLEKDPPPQGSAARDAYHLNLAIHRRMIAGTLKEKIESAKALRELADGAAAGRMVRDATMIRLLGDAPASPLAMVLPKRLRRIFFRNGIPLFGLKAWAAGAMAVLASAVVFWQFPMPETPVAQTGGVFAATFVHIPAGTFTMGSPSDEPGRWSWETQHEVTLTKGFYMQTTEVTQAQWRAVMGTNPSRFKNCGDDCPVESVSWEDATEFVRRLNEREGKEIYSLPTEAQWERACRAGTNTALYNGPIDILGECNAPALDPIAWYGGNSGVTYEGGYDSSKWPEKQYDHQRAGAHPVGQKKPNAWGLYDMIGNVHEWCQDWYGGYPKTAVVDPRGFKTGDVRVVRGGSWSHCARFCRSASRYWLTQDGRSGYVGFRLARSLL